MKIRDTGSFIKEFRRRRPLHLSLMVLTGLIISTSICLAGSGREPFALMDAEEFKAALEHSAGKVVLLDARPAERYLDGHLKGAVNIFAPDLERDPSLLKASK